MFLWHEKGAAAVGTAAAAFAAGSAWNGAIRCFDTEDDPADGAPALPDQIIPIGAAEIALPEGIISLK